MRFDFASDENADYNDAQLLSTVHEDLNDSRSDSVCDAMPDATKMNKVTYNSDKIEKDIKVTPIVNSSPCHKNDVFKTPNNMCQTEAVITYMRTNQQIHME